MNPVFWVAITLLILLAMLFVLVPVLRSKPLTSSNDIAIRRDKNREVYQQRLQELDEEISEGIVAEEDAERVRTELQRAFMKDMEELDAAEAAPSASQGRVLPLALMLLVPLISILVYRQWGASQDLVLPELMQNLGAAQDEADMFSAMEALAPVLQDRFDRHPEDVLNGYMLGQLYEQLKNLDAAEVTFRRLLSQLDEDRNKATVYGVLARILYTKNAGEITADVQQALDGAQAIYSNEFNSMGLLANDALQHDDLVSALGYWRRQLSSAPPGSGDANRLRQIIGMVEQSMSEDDRQLAAGPALTLTIDLDPQLSAELAGKQSLFVFVRRPEGGPPILAKNLSIPEFPVTLSLDNSDSMMGMTLESAETLVAGARLSETGSPTSTSGDLETLSEPFRLADTDGTLSLVIDQLVP